MKSGLKKEYKYIRIEGNVIASDTGRAKGVFAIISKLLLSGEMEQEDADHVVPGEGIGKIKQAFGVFSLYNADW